MKKITTTLFLAAIGIAVSAAPVSKARIDVSSNRKFVLKPGKALNGYVKNISWGKKEHRKFYITSESNPLKAGKWTKVTMSFIPAADGNLSIGLMGNYSKTKGKKNLNAHWILFDNVKVTGATLVNGDFEKANKGKPAGWWTKTKNYITGSKPGEAKVRAWHNERVAQTIKGKKGQEITITYEAKPEKIEMAKK